MGAAICMKLLFLTYMHVCACVWTMLQDTLHPPAPSPTAGGSQNH